jgi:hypothetical protein
MRGTVRRIVSFWVENHSLPCFEFPLYYALILVFMLGRPDSAGGLLDRGHRGPRAQAWRPGTKLVSATIVRGPRAMT